MSIENQSLNENLTTVTNELRRRLGMQNINAILNIVNEEPTLLVLDGAINVTEPAGGDDDIALVLSQMKTLYPEYTFAYDKQGAIAIHNKPNLTH